MLGRSICVVHIVKKIIGLTPIIGCKVEKVIGVIEVIEIFIFL